MGLLALAVVTWAAWGGRAQARQRREPATLWPSGAGPAIRDVGPDKPVELGVRFRVEVPGEVVGIRFFRGATNVGPHPVSLWTGEGQLLARAAARAAGSPGWQRVDFAEPVAVEAGRDYVASYHAPSGHYSVDHGYFAKAVQRPPLRAGADRAGAPNGLFAYGPAGTFPAQGHQSSNYWVDVVFRPSPEPGRILVALEVDPRHGALWLGERGRLTATARYADGSSRDASALVRWRSGSPESIAVDESGGLEALREGGTTVTATLGTASGAAAVIALAKPPAAGPAPSAASLWPSHLAVAASDVGLDGPLEAGVRFTVDVAGYVTAVRFHRSPGDAGAATVRLWSGQGALLSEAAARASAEGGWQEVLLPSPVAVVAGERYVASRQVARGRIGLTRGYFEDGLANPPLRVQVGTPANVGGVFAVGRPGAFPTEAHDGANAWVDVVFVPAAPSPPLRSIRVEPARAEVEVGESRRLRATGSYQGEESDLTRVVQWESSDPAAIAVDADGVASAWRAGSARLVARLRGVAGEARLDARPLPPASPEGPGGPILIVSSGANGFSRYLAEILRAEGLNEFLATDVSQVDRALLDRHDLAILGDFPISAGEAELFASWVRGGGRLIAMRPDPQLAPLMGLRKVPGVLEEGYLQVEKGPGPASGITRRAMQIHGAADLYALDGARPIAALLRGAGQRTAHPAIALRAVGGGQAAAFAYDLARSVVYTRQGNPAWSGESRSGAVPRRPHDLFYGAAAFDPRPNWVDFSRIDLPQADEQQRLLVNVILHMMDRRKPLPRFWYLPSGLPAAVVMTGDDHAIRGPSQRLREYLQRSRSGCSVPDWECVRATSYVYALDPLTTNEALEYAELGFEVSLHLTTECSDFASPEELEAQYARQLSTFALSYPGLPRPRTTRTHCVAWSDYETQPRVEQGHGIRLDTNYYFWPASWVRDRPGFMTGSALPMRFADRAGRVIDVFQLATQMTDESGQGYPATVERLLDGALGPAGHYGFLTANMHTDEATSSAGEAILSAARARGFPVISALQVLEWVDARNGSSFGSLEWDGRALGFTIRVAPGARNLQAMLPARAGKAEIRAITRGDREVRFATRTVRGVRYAVFPATAGEYRAAYR